MYKYIGFTLIELMIVVTIISILAGIALPSYQKYTIRAQVSEAMALSDGVKVSIKEYYEHHGRFPKNNASAGVPEPQFLIGNYVKSISVENGSVNIEFGNKIPEHLSGKRLSFQPLVVIGSPGSPISWNCGHSNSPTGMRAIGTNDTTIDAQFLPPVCRADS